MPGFSAFPKFAHHSHSEAEEQEQEETSTSFYLAYEKWPRLEHNSGLVSPPTRSAWFPDALLLPTTVAAEEQSAHPKHIATFSAPSPRRKAVLKHAVAVDLSGEAAGT